MMVKAKRELVFATFITSGLAVIASFVALGTQNWASAYVTISETRNSHVHYGLFTGIYTRRVANDQGITYDISMTCLMSENVCAMLCDSTSEARTKTLTKMFNNDEISTFPCTNNRRSPPYGVHYFAQRDAVEKEFINAGMWITTIIFLVLSCVAGLVATVLAMWNTVYNPIEVYFNITGLFIWNSIATVFSLLTIVIWGILFATTLIDNICVFDTIQEASVSNESAVLHFSYWLNLVAFLLYIASMVVLGVRQYLINKEPIVTHTLDDSAYPGLLIY